MNRDEAIKNLENIKYTYRNLLNRAGMDWTDDEWETFKLAIEILKQEPSDDYRSLADILDRLNELDGDIDTLDLVAKEIKALPSIRPSGDCISREAVIKAVDKHTIETEKGLLLDEDISIILEDLPSILPKKGEWICDHKQPYWQDRYVCSNCGIEKYFRTSEKYNFCPHCGADMRGKENTDEID